MKNNEYRMGNVPRQADEMPEAGGQRCRLEQKIRQVSFVLYETALYLDTHPGCRQALAYFDRYNRQLRELVNRYEGRFGPLTFAGQKEGCSRWQWVETPFPWEYPEESAKDCGCP